MINFRSVYFNSEEKIKQAVWLMFGLLAFFLIVQSLFSPLIALVFLFFVVVLLVTFISPTTTLGFLALYLPFESVILKFIPDGIYVVSRFFSEWLIYLIALVVLWRWLTGRIRISRTALDMPFVLFVVSLIASIAIQFIPIPIAILGLRQILRFLVVFFLVVYLSPSTSYIKKLTFALLVIVLIQSGIGIAQAFIGEPLDRFLISSNERTFGEFTLTFGVEQFWDPGSRVFATLGRYDRLGNFLYIFLLFASGFLFTLAHKTNKLQPILWWVFALGIPALVLTYSRSSWFAFLIGFLFIGLIIKRDKKVFAGLLASIIIILGHLALSGLTVGLITETPGQSLSERFFESFSYARWRGEYFGLGRVFWYVQTPVTVVASSPIFGWGPGQFGGGAVAALHNTTIYDHLDLPFGVFGTEGFIDNNWFALWGEAGTLGLLFFLWMYLALFRHSLGVYHHSHDPYVNGLAIGLAAVLLAVGFNAFTSTIFEIRTVAFYLWLYGGFVYVLGKEAT
jgi:O-antigen ligase